MLLSLLLICFQNIFAQSKITIYHEKGERFWVIVDGKKINELPQERVDIFDIQTAYIKVLLIFENEKIPNLDRTLATRDVDGKYTYSKYVIRQKGTNAQLRLYSMEIIEVPQQNVMHQQLPPQKSEPSTITVQPSLPTTTQQQNVSTSVQIIDPETAQPVGISVQVQMPTEVPIQSQQQVTIQIQTEQMQQNALNPVTGQSPGQPQQMISTKYPCRTYMNDADFQQAKSSIASKNFEDSKLTIAKQITASNCLLSSQVKQIMQLFNFESSRLEYAKFAYDYVYDKANYFQVYDAFQFESSIEELNDHLKRNK